MPSIIEYPTPLKLISQYLPHEVTFNPLMCMLCCDSLTSAIESVFLAFIFTPFHLRTFLLLITVGLNSLGSLCGTYNCNVTV